jgi:poly(A) polymerase
VLQDPRIESPETQQLAQLQRILLALTAEGAACWVVGEAASAVLSCQLLPRWTPWHIAVEGPIAAIAPEDLGVAVTVTALPGGSDDLPSLLAREPIRAWALAMDARGQTFDPWHNADDARDRRLRIPGDPRAWMAKGPERVLDLAVLAARSGLTPDKELLRLARRDAGNVLSVDRALWAERFGEVLLGEHAGAGLQFLYDCEALHRMVPEVCLMVDFHKSCPVHHKDIWDHTLQVVEKCPQALAVRWAALMHDSGKVWTRSVNKQGKVHFFRHEELGASLMEGVAGRFHLDPALQDRVVYVIGNHARANVYAAEWTDSAVRRLIRDMGPHLDDVLAFSSSDFTTKRQWRITEVRHLAEQLHKRIREVAAEDAKVPPLPKGLGHVIMQALSLAPGPWLGEVQRWLEAEVEAGRVAPLLDASHYLAHVQEHKPELLRVEKGLERQRVSRSGK